MQATDTPQKQSQGDDTAPIQPIVDDVQTTETPSASVHITNPDFDPELRRVRFKLPAHVVKSMDKYYDEEFKQSGKTNHYKEEFRGAQFMAAIGEGQNAHKNLAEVEENLGTLSALVEIAKKQDSELRDELRIIARKNKALKKQAKLLKNIAVGIVVFFTVILLLIWRSVRRNAA